MENETGDSSYSYHSFSSESDLESLPAELLDKIPGELSPRGLKSFRESSKTLAYKGYDKPLELYRRGDIKEAIKKGYTHTVKRLLEQTEYSKRDLNKFLRFAAKEGHRNLVEFFINEKGVRDWIGGMYGAAEGGNRDLVDFFESKIQEEM